MWFIQKSFYEAQKNGQIPWDETFDAVFILHVAGKKGTFPLWLSKDLRIKIETFSKENKCIDYTSSEWIGKDELDTYHGISWLMIDEKNGVYTQTVMRNKRFPIVVSEVLSEILIFQLYEELVRVQQHKTCPIMVDHIDRIINSYCEKYERIRFTGLIRPTIKINNSMH